MADGDLTFRQGATWRWSMVWTAAGRPANLTGAAVVMEVRRRWADDEPGVEPVLRLELGDGLTVADPLAGQVDAVVGADVTRPIPYGSYRWEAKVVGAAGAADAWSLAVGSLTVAPEVERPVA